MREERGAIAVVVAFFSVVAFGFAAIVVDLGYARSVKAKAQDAADSAALAGAAALFASGPAPAFNTAATAAQNIANGILGIAPSAWAGCTDPAALPGFQLGCVSFDSATDPREVRVRVPNTNVSSFFGSVYGYGGTTISATAVASLGPVEFTPECAICVLGSGPHVLDSARVRADAADISFNGDVELRGTSEVRAVNRTVFLDGDAIGPIGGFRDFLVTQADPVDDPLDAESPPPTEPPRTDPCSSDPAIGGSGTYTSVTLTGTCTLLPGETYIIDGDLTAAPNAIITGINVRFWVRGSIDLSAAARVDIDSPATASLIYADNGDVVTIDLLGAPIADIDGDINAPSGVMAGGPCGQATVDGVIVAGRLSIGPGACLASVASTARTTAPTQPPVLIR